MTRSFLRRLSLLLLLIMAGALAPSPLFAADYLLFVTTASDTRGLVFTMDGDGYLRPREELKIGYDVERLAVSPDRRTVVFSACTTPTLTTIFIRDDGALAPPVYLSHPSQWWTRMAVFNPVAFHPSLPLFYVTTETSTTAFRYDRPAGRVEPTGQSWALGASNMGELFYSPWCGGLIFQDYEPTDFSTVPVGEDGALGAPGPLLRLPMRATSDFVLSPDGRWAAGAAQNQGGLELLAVHQDGSLALADRQTTDTQASVNFNFLSFSPDSRRVYLLSQGRPLLTCYRLDPETGKLSERAVLTRAGLGYQFSLAMPLVLTPDGRYAVFRAVDEKNNDFNVLHVVRLYEDGSMQYLPDHQVVVNQYLGMMAFTYLPHDAAGPQWALYE